MSEVKVENISEKEMQDALHAMVNDMVDKLVDHASKANKEDK